MSKLRKIILTALLIAAEIVLSRFLTIRTPIVSVDFYFVPLVFAAILLGPASSTFVATISDIIGALLFPSGSFFPGFTLTAALTGLTFGLLLHQKTPQFGKKFVVRLIISALIVTIFLNGVLNTIWIFIITGGASNIILPVRILKQLILAPVIVLTTLALVKIFAGEIQKLHSSSPQDDSTQKTSAESSKSHESNLKSKSDAPKSA